MLIGKPRFNLNARLGLKISLIPSWSQHLEIHMTTSFLACLHGINASWIFFRNNSVGMILGNFQLLFSEIVKLMVSHRVEVLGRENNRAGMFGIRFQCADWSSSTLRHDYCTIILFHDENNSFKAEEMKGIIWAPHLDKLLWLLCHEYLIAVHPLLQQLLHHVAEGGKGFRVKIHWLHSQNNLMIVGIHTCRYTFFSYPKSKPVFTTYFWILQPRPSSPKHRYPDMDQLSSH